MSSPVTVAVCGAGAPWEAALVRGLQRRELGVEVSRRCVDRAELLGVALRDRPAAVLLRAELPWLDRDLVGTLHDAGVAVVAVEREAGSRPLERIGVTHRVTADATADEVAALLWSLDEPTPPLPAGGEATRSQDPAGGPAPGPPAPAGVLTAVWGGPGAPGRTSVAVHLAVEAARRGRRCILVEGDTWAPCLAQLLGLPDGPGLAQAARLAIDGWPRPLASVLHDGPHGVQVLAGLPRAELWPELRERAWRAILDAARDEADVVVVDIAAPIEEDEELSFDRVPFRRNLATRVALAEATGIVMVVAGHPVGIRHGVLARQQLERDLPLAASRASTVVNRSPRGARRLQDCSTELARFTGAAPVAFLPVEPAFERVVWEGRILHEVAARSAWLRELRGLVDRIEPAVAA
ncbi:MAG: chromosome partitioning protein [Acidimicrobiia bacterium]|nr:chromosome partitioning protein [Acidimicrobiia bacterium]